MGGVASKEAAFSPSLKAPKPEDSDDTMDLISPTTQRPSQIPRAADASHPRNPILAVSTAHGKDPSANLFLPLTSPAFFSPSVPSSTTDLWKAHGGTQIPIPSDLQLAPQRQYLNIPQSTLDNLDNLLHTAQYTFVTPSDPLLFFIRNPDVVLIDQRWIVDCVAEGRLLEMDGYRVDVPSEGRRGVAEVQRTLKGLVGKLQPSPGRNREDSSTDDDQRQVTGGSPFIRNPRHKVVSADPAPRPLKPKTPPRKRKQFILQPYLELVLPSTHTTSASCEGQHTHNHPIQKRKKHRNPATFEAMPSAAQTSFIQLPANFDQTNLDLPTFEFTLETELAPGFRLDLLDELQMAQLIREIVEDASSGMAGDLRLWDEGEEGEQEEETDNEGAEREEHEGGVKEEMVPDADCEEGIRMDEERGVEGLIQLRSETSTNFGLEPMSEERPQGRQMKREEEGREHHPRALLQPDVDKDRAIPITPTPARRAPIRADTSIYDTTPNNDRFRQKVGRKRPAPIDDKKENKRMGRAPVYTGPGSSQAVGLLALTTQNLRRQQASMDEEEIKDEVANDKRESKRKRARSAGLPIEDRIQYPSARLNQPKPKDEKSERPIWKDRMAERRYKVND